MSEELAVLMQACQEECAKVEGMPIRIELTTLQALVLVANIQLACRHPLHTGESAQEARRMAQSIQAMLGALCGPATQAIIEKGWEEP